jgi:hypothetical protein
MTNQTLLDHIHANSADNVLAVALHGSSVSGTSDAWSDVDVLCVTEGRKGHQAFLELPSTVIDIAYCTQNELRAAQSSTYWRNNYHLLAMVTSKILLDPHRILETLTRDAMELWEAGLPPILEAQKLDFRTSLRKLDHALTLSSLRIARSPETLAVLHAKVDSLHQQILMMYQRARMKWAFQPWIVDSLREDPLYAEIALFKSEFFQATSSLSKIELAKALVSKTETLLRANSATDGHG